MRVLYSGQIGIWRSWFLWREEFRLEPGEKASEQGENQPQIRPTYGTRPESNPGPGGRHVLSPLCHPK